MQSANNRHKEGEAIAGYALKELGPKWRISYRGDRNCWEIRNVLDPDMIFGTYSHTETDWQYRPNPTVSNPVRSSIDWAIQQGMQAIAQAQEVK